MSVSGTISHSNHLLRGWYSDLDLAGGGALWDLGWHTFDTILYLLNRKASAVDAEIHFLEKEKVEMYANALIHFEENLSVTVSANFGAPKNSVYERMQIWGIKGMLTIDRSMPIYNQHPAHAPSSVSPNPKKMPWPNATTI